jgi:hypothetical protein
MGKRSGGKRLAIVSLLARPPSLLSRGGDIGFDLFRSYPAGDSTLDALHERVETLTPVVGVAKVLREILVDRRRTRTAMLWPVSAARCFRARI